MNDQEVLTPKYQPGVEYLYSPAQDLIVPKQPLLLKMNTHNGDWCLLTVEEPDPELVLQQAQTEMRRLSYRPGMTEAELQKACAEAPGEAIELARHKAYYNVILASIPHAKARAAARGKITVQKEDLREAMKQSIKGRGNTLDLSKPIPEVDKPAAATTTGKKA